MTMAIFGKTLQFFALVGFVLGTVNCEKVQAESDDQFEDFLKNVMDKYPDWLQENKLDPSPPINDSMGGYHKGVWLDCKLTNHYVIGHSKIGDDFYGGESSLFSIHYFEVVRFVVSLHEFHGDFKCTGSLSKSFYPELSSDLTFNGYGKFVVSSNSSFEYLTMYNVGVTQDYKLDLSHSWTEYTLHATQKFFNLKGQWDEPLVNIMYLVDIENAFSERFDLATESQISRERAKFPTGQLLERYVREFAEGLDLKEIIKQEDLPATYLPTPRPTTSTTTEMPTSSDKNAADQNTVVSHLIYFMLILSNIFYLYV